jgi:hypothetical protein
MLDNARNSKIEKKLIKQYNTEESLNLRHKLAKRSQNQSKMSMSNIAKVANFSKI